MEDEDERSIELSSVEAIFPEIILKGPFRIFLELPVPLERPVRVIFPAVAQVAPPPSSLHDTLSFQLNLHKSNQNMKEVHYLWNLPPLDVDISLPQDYPANEPPEVTLTPQQPWLPQSKLDELRELGRVLWEELGHDQVVYAYIEQLQEAAERCFDLAPDGTIDIPPELKVALLDYDAKVKKLKFDRETFECGVCLEPKKGATCHRLLDCGHVFCVQCLQDFYNSCITEGDVDGVRCMDPSCGKKKCGQQAENGNRRRRKPKKLQPSELLQIPIAEDKVERYIKLRRKRRLEANPNTVYCPRQWCQGPARVGEQPSSDENSDDEDSPERGEPAAPEIAQNLPQENGGGGDSEREESPSNGQPPLVERLAICTDCSFAFCIVCKKGWHGEFGWCSIRSRGEVSREERASEEYLKKHSTPCPTCNARAQKTMGCNHMLCRQCKTHFCYLCSSCLLPDNPYKHFNTIGSPCYQKLWELNEGDGEGAPARPEPPPIEVIFEEDPPPRREENRRQGQQPQQPARNVPPPAPVPPRPPQQHVQGVRVNRRVQQGLARPAQPMMNPIRGHGLQRFLELANRDQEDEWDSDEMDDDEEELVQFALMDGAGRAFRR